MVDKVKLNPMQFSKRSGGLSVPQAGDIPSLRNLPAVQDVGTESQAKAFMSLADDGTRLANMAGEQFERHIREVETLQAIEFEKDLSGFMLQTQAELENVRLNTEDAEQIPSKSLSVFNRLKDKFLNQTNLSSFQKSLAAEKLIQIERNVGSNSLSYQAQLRKAEAEFAIDEVVQSRLMMARKDPSLLTSFKGEMAEIVDQFGLGLTPLEKAKTLDSIQSQLTLASVSGLIEKDPYNAMRRIKSEEFSRDLDFEDRLRLEDMADREISVRESVSAKHQKEQQGRIDRELRARVLKQVMGVTDESGEVPNVSMVDIINSGASLSTQEAAFKLLTEEINETGNPRVTNQLAVEISKARRSGQPFDYKSIEQAVAGADGQPPISVSEFQTLNKMFEERLNPSVEQFLDTAEKMDAFKSDVGRQKLLSLRQEAYRQAEELIEKGQNPSIAFTQGTGSYIGQSLLDSYMPTIQDETEFMMRQLNVAPKIQDDPFTNLVINDKTISQDEIVEAAEELNIPVDEVIRQLITQGLVRYE